MRSVPLEINSFGSKDIPRGKLNIDTIRFKLNVECYESISVASQGVALFVPTCFARNVNNVPRILTHGIESRYVPMTPVTLGDRHASSTKRWKSSETELGRGSTVLGEPTLFSRPTETFDDVLVRLNPHGQ